MQELIRKADVLNEALPFIQEFKNSIAVVKFGGSAMENPELTRKTMRDIVLLEAIGMKMVVVHGGGKAISARLRELGVQTQFINGLRVTDAQGAARPVSTPLLIEHLLTLQGRDDFRQGDHACRKALVIGS